MNILDAIAKSRSIRRFDNVPIAREDIEKILTELAEWKTEETNHSCPDATSLQKPEENIV